MQNIQKLVKIVVIVISCIFTFSTVFAEETTNGLVTGTDAGKQLVIEKPVDIRCEGYEDCISKYNSLDLEQQKKVVMIYYNSSKNELRYNIYNDIVLRIGSNSCPPVIDFYQKINNINYILDIYQRYSTSECTSYFVNINGTGMERGSVTGQLETVFCNKNSVEQLCDQGVFLIKKNDFIK